MPQHDDPIGYSAMIHDALRSVVRKTLLQVKEIGMPKDHLFYITFKTMAPQVVLPLYLRQKYPESMTIVLQYQFYNLTITDSLFSVSLSFGGKFETLTVPFAAIVMFSDPEAQLVFNFEPATQTLSDPALPATQQPAPLATAPTAAAFTSAAITSAAISSFADKKPTEKPLSSTGKKNAHASKNPKNTQDNTQDNIQGNTHGNAQAKTPTKSPTKSPPWHGSVAYGAQMPFETPQGKPQTTGQTKGQTTGQARRQTKLQNKDRLQPVATKTSAKVLTFRPKNAPRDDATPSKTP